MTHIEATMFISFDWGWLSERLGIADVHKTLKRIETQMTVLTDSLAKTGEAVDLLLSTQSLLIEKLVAIGADVQYLLGMVNNPDLTLTPEQLSEFAARADQAIELANQYRNIAESIPDYVPENPPV